MLLILLVLVLLAMTIIGWYVSRDIFSPFFVQPGVWVAIFLLYFIISPNYLTIGYHLPLSLLLFSLTFMVGSYLSFYFTQNSPGTILAPDPNQTIVKAYLWISLLTIPYMLFVVIRMALDKDPEHILLFIRMVNTGYSDDPEAHIDFGVASYAIPIPYVLLLFALFYTKSKWQKALVIFLNILVGVLSMSKTNFLSIIFAIVYLLHVQKKIKPKTIAWTFLIFFVVMMAFQFIRSSDSDQESFGLAHTLSMYLFTGFVAYDHFSIPESAHYFGENCLRFVYAITYALGGDIPPVNTLNEFVEVPQPTNVFTILHPFNVDFGYPGLFVFGLLYGLLYGFLYKKTGHPHNVYKIIYTIFLNYLLLEFFAEYILLNLSLTIQYLLYAILPFLIAPRKEKQNGT